MSTALYIPKNLVVGFHSYKEELGFVTYNENDDESKPLNSQKSFDNWRSKNKPLQYVENTPTSGYEFAGINRRYGGHFSSSRNIALVRHPLGFRFEVEMNQLLYILANTTVINGIIQEPMVWAKGNVLVVADSEDYRECVDFTAMRQGKVKSATLQIGSVVRLTALKSKSATMTAIFQYPKGDFLFVDDKFKSLRRKKGSWSVVTDEIVSDGRLEELRRGLRTKDNITFGESVFTLNLADSKRVIAAIDKATAETEYPDVNLLLSQDGGETVIVCNWFRNSTGLQLAPIQLQDVEKDWRKPFVYEDFAVTKDKLFTMFKCNDYKLFSWSRIGHAQALVKNAQNTSELELALKPYGVYNLSRTDKFDGFTWNVVEAGRVDKAFRY